MPDILPQEPSESPMTGGLDFVSHTNCPSRRDSRCSGYVDNLPASDTPIIGSIRPIFKDDTELMMRDCTAF